MKVFYSNPIKQDKSLKSWVNGVEITLTNSRISTILWLLNEEALLQSETKDKNDEFKKIEVYLSMCRVPREEALGKRQKTEEGAAKYKLILFVGNLHLNEIMMHYFLAYVIIPKETNYSQLTKFKVKLLDALKHNVIVIWPYVVKNHMFASSLNTKGLS